MELQMWTSESRLSLRPQQEHATRVWMLNKYTPPPFYIAYNSLFTKFLKYAVHSYFRDDFKTNIVIVPKDSSLTHTQNKNQLTTKNFFPTS